MDSKRISSVLFSLAETHCDRGEYKEALQYYERELTIWADHPIEVTNIITSVLIIVLLLF